jgi:aminoglycoside phosphotransferase (APT) family kinase protein
MSDPAASPDNLEARVVAWIEKEIGPVLAITRQGRWRPAWFVDAEKNGAPMPLYVRGGRGAKNFPPMPLAYEADVLKLFAKHGVRVPHVHGVIEDIPAIVMDRLPGRPNIATAENDHQRARLRLELAEQMRKIHEIDPAHLVALGAATSEDPREVSLLHYRQIEKLYLEGDSLPSPDIEFARAWLNRNAPACVEGPAVLTVDAGQFMFEGDEITGLLDLELACVGDRHVDLAALRTRDRIEEIGDLDSFYDLYRQCGGIALDRDRIAYQWVTFAMLTPLQIANDQAHPEKYADYHAYFTWHVTLMDDVLKDIARLCDVTLERYVVPEATPDRTNLLLQALISVVEALPASDDYESYRRFDLALALKYVADFTARARVLEREYLDDVEALTGRRPRDAWDGDVQMVEFVRGAGPERDAAILQLLYRRNERVYQIMRKHFQQRREGMEMD